MMKFLALSALLVGVITAATDSEWMVYKAKHGKRYHQEEDYLRRMIYEDNLKTIQSHNELFAKGMKSYYLGENEYADMTSSEFVKTMNGYRGSEYRPQANGNVFKMTNQSLPSEVNWVKKGYVTGVKSQGRCLSCWSFSTTGSLEGAHFKATGKLVSLSEKNLMDCSRAYGNYGCEGGLMVNAFRYIIANKGDDTEASYPYVPRDGRCEFNRSDVGATMKSFVEVEHGSELALQQASATVGPISVGIDANHTSIQFYEGGVYYEPKCRSSRHALDHGVLVVGYGSLNGKDYWLVKNSWGLGWGMHGYIMMSRNRQNNCGIATLASYPVV